MKLLWEQLSRSVSEPVHWTPLTVGDWESSLNKPLVTAIAPVCVCTYTCVNVWVYIYTCNIKINIVMMHCTNFTTASSQYESVICSCFMYHMERIQVVCRPQKHLDYPRSHHTLYHTSHSYTLQLCPLLAHLWWSNSLGKCSDSYSRLCYHQPAASSCPQCKQLLIRLKVNMIQLKGLEVNMNLFAIKLTHAGLSQ